jgi:hypothetical protein
LGSRLLPYAAYCTPRRLPNLATLSVERECPRGTMRA